MATRKTRRLRKHYPQYKNHELHFGIASKIIDEDLIKSAKLEQVCLITQQEDHVTVANGQMVRVTFNFLLSLSTLTMLYS